MVSGPAGVEGRAPAGEWRLHPQVVSEIWRRLGRAEVDLFAPRESTHCPFFFSMRNRPLGWDALVHSGPRVLLYTFPPFTLLQPLLRRVLVERMRLILVAPLWPHMLWFSAIPPLLDGLPWELPHQRDLLSKANGALFHPFPEGLRLMAWPLRGTGSWPEGCRSLQSSMPGLHPQGLPIHTICRCLPPGVCLTRWTPIWPRLRRSCGSCGPSLRHIRPL